MEFPSKSMRIQGISIGNQRESKEFQSKSMGIQGIPTKRYAHSAGPDVKEFISNTIKIKKTRARFYDNNKNICFILYIY